MSKRARSDSTPRLHAVTDSRVLADPRFVLTLTATVPALDSPGATMTTALLTSADITTLEPPGVICPGQFRDLWSATTHSSGEIRLAMAVLLRAIEDLRRFRGGAEGSAEGRLYRQARQWIVSSDRQWPYSFENVSEIVNISSARLRTRLLEPVPIRSMVA
jgi:hypothetical protein